MHLTFPSLPPSILYPACLCTPLNVDAHLANFCRGNQTRFEDKPSGSEAKGGGGTSPPASSGGAGSDLDDLAARFANLRK